MNFIIKSNRVPTGRRPIHEWPLTKLLLRFGIEPVKDPLTSKRITFGRRVHRSLWDILDAVKARWQKLRRKLHPDAGGNTEAFAVMGRIYITIMQRLKARGI